MIGVCQFIGVVRKPPCLDEASPEKERLKRMLAPSPSRSPRTVMPLASGHSRIIIIRALTRLYIELSKGSVLNWSIGLGGLRIIDKSYFDPYNALALVFAFLDVIYRGCSAKYRAGYFKTLPGKFCIVSVFTLAVKFCKSDALRSTWSFNGANDGVRTTELIYNFMFGQHQHQLGLQKGITELLFETEAYLLSRMGGRLYALSYAHASFKIEEALEIALSTARDQERKTILVARAIAVVYTLSVQCADNIDGGTADTQAQVALLIACQSMISCGVTLPERLEQWTFATYTVTSAAVRLLRHCLEFPESVQLIQESVRDVECGRFFEAAIQQKTMKRICCEQNN